VIRLHLPWGGSSLLDKKMKIPRRKAIDPGVIPSTYVPARNIIFLSYAASFAEAIGAEAIFIGANALDFSGYPDCRPLFFKAFQAALKKGLKTTTEGRTLDVQTPLLHKTKSQIIRLGKTLGVPYHLTWSCYQGLKKPCGVCDSCRLRQKGFSQLKMVDPASSDNYAKS
jgi:7-cyano-7-deazaguanine synthase